MTNPAVLITGAGSGIGEATAQQFSDHGYGVVLVGRQREKLERVSKNLTSPSVVLPCDLRSENEVAWMAKEATKAMAGISVIVNNAGIYNRLPFADTTDEDWETQIQTNLLGTVRVIRHFLGHLETQENASIVNVASTLGLRPVPQVSAYGATKAAVVNLTQSLALEFAPKKIRVNAVALGIVDTPIHKFDTLSKSDAARLQAQMAALHPLGRIGTPQEAAWAIYQFCVPEASWTTGAILTVDGGINLT